MKPEPSPSVAVVILYPGCTVAEVIELATRLNDAGLRVIHAAQQPSVVVDRSGLRMEPDTTINHIDPTDVDVVIIPGGDPESIIEDRPTAKLLNEVVESGGLVGGICAGVLIMAAAGLTRGRSITHNYRAPWASADVVAFVEPFWEGALVEQDPTVGVVVDGPVITALPNATIEFAMTVCTHQGIYTAEHAALIGRHLSGRFVDELYRR